MTKKQRFVKDFKRDWQLHLLVLFPVVYMFIFDFIPMYGIQIAFRDFRPISGITGSEWVGLKWIKNFLSSPDFLEIFGNTISLSLYSFATFPIPIIFALVLNALRGEKYKKVVQTVSYMPHFISTTVMVGIINMLCSPVSGIYALCYAKWVDADILSIKMQASEDKTKLRLVSSVDTLDYLNVGFEIYFTPEGQTERKTTFEASTVLKRINAVNTGVTYAYSPKIISADSEYFVTATMTEIAPKNLDRDFYIRPYWTTWTDDLPETFAKAYEGEELLANVPELIWERADRNPSVIRYHYHDHVCERFVEAFADNCGAWCKEHGIALTGHVMEEPTLKSQTSSLGEAMRNYRGFGIPGIDMLCANFEFTTAKQAQSAVHQYGREGMLSELYGVTGWDFDFRGHKLHGDWQAALGVTVRVPHLSWVSMGGEAKRDYPASIHYQSPWWEKYSLVENHFARVGTAMTRGKAEVKVGVIHPIESYWLHFGPSEQTAMVRDNLDENFQNITKWLLFGGVDFDFISESLLPALCKEGNAPLQVGEMAYDMILVPGCETLRSTTLERLEGFVKAGGKLVFVGDIPTLEDARQSKRGQVLAEQAKVVQFNKGSVLDAVEQVRLVELRNETGAMTTNLLHQLRVDGDGRWLFVAHGAEPRNKHISEKQDVTIRVKGAWKATIYNTMTGEQECAKQSLKGDVTEVYQTMYDYDSLLLWLEPIAEASRCDMAFSDCKDQSAKAVTTKESLAIPDYVEYTLSEPNALVLDMAEYALDGGEWHAKEELLRLDVECRKMLGWSTDIAHVAQPWSLGEETEFHRVSLKFSVESAIEYDGAHLAIEKAEDVIIRWNGKEVDNHVIGWYVDKAIQTIALPRVEKGQNVLEVEVPIGKRTMVEWMYILGDFGVEVYGKNTRIVSKRETLAFGDVTVQGLPFYTGNITYHIPIATDGGDISIRSGFYEGAMQEVSVDGQDAVPMIYPPYIVDLGTVEAGKHTVDLTLYGTRQNGFGTLHLADEKRTFINPSSWRTEGDYWCYEYMLRRMGVLAAPEVVIN